METFFVDVLLASDISHTLAGYTKYHVLRQCTVTLAKLAICVSNSTLLRTSIISFGGIRCLCKTTVAIHSKYSNTMPLDKTVAVPVLFAFSHGCLAIRTLIYVLVTVILDDVASEAVAILTTTSASVLFAAKIETGLEFHSPTSFD